jgi:putative nucleotidyltransferase with HDIG domain
MLLELTRAVETAHPWTEGHSGRVAELALAVGRALGWSEDELETVSTGALLHDVGKLSLSTEVLGKPGPLSGAEIEAVRRHPVAGARLVRAIPAARRALPVVLHHHERWDGTGYPGKLVGPATPVEARLIALADAYDAMVSVRPYRAALSHDAALGEIARCAGTQFDPLLAHACLELWPARLAMAV